MEPIDLPAGIDILTAIVDGIGDAVCILDKKFRIKFQNRAHKEQAGDRKGEHCHKAFHGSDAV